MTEVREKNLFTPPLPWLRRAVWVSVWFALALLASVIPPMQSPDEPAHLGRAATIADGRWLLQTPPGHDTGQWVDVGLLTFMMTGNNISARGDARSSAQDQALMARQRWTGEHMFFPIPGMNYYLPLLYAPHATGLLIGRTLDLNIAHSYQLARAMVWGACVLLLAAAWRASPPSPLAVGLLLLPMSTFQLASPTLDGLTSCLALWVLGVFCSRYQQPERLQSGVMKALWLLAVVILASGRTHLFPFLLLPMALAWRQGTVRGWLSAISAAVVSLAWVLFTLVTTRDTRIPREHSSKELLLHYARHPLEYLQIVGATLKDPGHADNYAETFVGRLGWLDAPLPASAHEWLWSGLALCAVLSLPLPRLMRRRHADHKEPTTEGSLLGLRFILICVALSSMGLVFLALLVTWTPHPAQFIDGIQGRYFMIPALVLAYAVSDLRPHGIRWLRWLQWGALIAFALFAGWACVTSLMMRYH